MPDAPSPITSPPAEPWQPYDATAEGGSDPQITPLTIYDAEGGSGSGNPWPKVREAGAIDSSGASMPGDWPGNGASDGSKWKQT